MKTNLDSLFKTDKSKETEGEWFPVGNDVEFKIKRMGGNNKAVAKLYAAKAKPFIRKIKSGTLDEETENRINVESFVEGCVTDWKNMVIDGEEKNYNSNLLVKMLLDPSMDDLLKKLMDFAMDSENFKVDYTMDEVEELGNS